MIKTINALLLTTALCGLLAVSPANAANSDGDRTAGAMPTATTDNTGRVGSFGEKSRTAGSIPAVNNPGPAVAASSKVSATTTVKRTRLTNRDVTEIQKQLADKGFYKSTVDGQFGPGTQQAMRDYQSSAGLEADGYPTMATLEKLGVTPENEPALGDAEPAGMGGVIFTETIENKQITEKSAGGFVNIESNSQNGGNCLHCTNGPIGNGGTKSMNSNAF